MRYPEIEQIDLVEIDEEVIKVCMDYLPSVSCEMRNEKVKIHIEDGLKYVRSKEDEYDLIIVDSTDPFGPGEGLLPRSFTGIATRR